MEDWKAQRLIIIKEFVGDRDYILLRSVASWNKKSDVDILCPSYPQPQELKRYNCKGLDLDIFTVYKIKNFEINYNTLKPYVINKNRELELEMEASLFFLKDYVHLTRFRNNKHKFYKKPKGTRNLLKDLKCPLILSRFLVPSSSKLTFYLRSFLVKIIYYSN